MYRPKIPLDHSSPFKTISSQSQTRQGTTNKKKTSNKKDKSKNKTKRQYQQQREHGRYQLGGQHQYQRERSSDSYRQHDPEDPESERNEQVRTIERDNNERFRYGRNRQNERSKQSERQIFREREREQQREQSYRCESQQSRETERPNYHINTLNEQMYLEQLKHLKSWQIHNRKYKAASLTQKKLKKTSGQAKLMCLKRLSLDHYHQRQNIKECHQIEIKKFHKVWNGVFDYYQEQRRSEIARWQRQQEGEYEHLRQSLTRKYHSMRSHSRQLIDLQREQKGLIKLNRFEDLHLLKLQKKKLKKKLQKQKNKQFMALVQVEDEKFRKSQTKRYNSLIMRVQESKKDAKRKYKHDELRLKQKYKNVLSQLNHEQTMEINDLLGKDIF